MTLSVSKALECLLLVVTPHVFPQEQMSMVLKTVDHLNQAKAEATDNERCAMKTETGVLGSANEEGANPSSIQKRVIIPRRSKRVPKGPCLGLAEDPIQDNSLECHEEKDCELPSILPTLFLKERERVMRPAVMQSQHLNRERKSRQTRTINPI